MKHHHKFIISCNYLILQNSANIIHVHKLLLINLFFSLMSTNIFHQKIKITLNQLHIFHHSLFQLLHHLRIARNHFFSTSRYSSSCRITVLWTWRLLTWASFFAIFSRKLTQVHIVSKSQLFINWFKMVRTCHSTQLPLLVFSNKFILMSLYLSCRIELT